MKIRRYNLLAVVVLLLLCSSCSSKKSGDEKTRDATPLEASTEDAGGKDTEQKNEENEMEEKINQYLQTMTLEEKVAQMFIVLPESLVEGVDPVIAAADATRNAIDQIPVGGFVYLDSNLQSPEQVKTMLANVQSYSMERIGLPALLCVDEEGGTVARISGTGKFNVPAVENMSVIGQADDTNRAREIGASIGASLAELGFNVDFAPVADVLTNPENQVVKKRSFGTDPQVVSDMCQAVAEGLKESGIYATYKHFPGHGMTSADTHAGYAYSDKTLEELESCELIPFQKGIADGISFVMVGHISMPGITGDQEPASLSEHMITEVLRKKMGYDGIVITDAMNMGAIVQQYSSSEAAVKTIQAGTDLILMPADFRSAYEGVIEAVHNGEISQERIDQSVTRILSVKLQIK